MRNMLPRIKEIREHIDNYDVNCLVSADGGIDRATGYDCVRAGADVLVTGSAFYRSVNKNDMLIYFDTVMK